MGGRRVDVVSSSNRAVAGFGRPPPGTGISFSCDEPKETGRVIQAAGAWDLAASAAAGLALGLVGVVGRERVIAIVLCLVVPAGSACIHSRRGQD